MKPIVIVFVLLLTASIPVQSTGEAIKEVRWGTETWLGITDGNGLYDMLMNEIFSSRGVKVVKIEYPLERAILLVKYGEIDFTGGIFKDRAPHDDYYQSPLPIFSVSISAFYRRDLFDEPPSSPKDLVGKKVCSTPLIGEGMGLLKDQYKEVRRKNQAFLMTVLGRCDVFLDESYGMELTIKKNYRRAYYSSAEAVLNDFKKIKISEAEIYMIAPKSERGKKIIELYVEGTKEIYLNGRMGEIFKVNNLTAPNLDKYLQR
ncbi:transporter substrate-binding domain-containing protein [Vibrio profundum]|uniref:hypothetical protein n=1 Tax=Vibrio profundum TaxID=2910247 RepID=UPI003D0FC818